MTPNAQRSQADPTGLASTPPLTPSFGGSLASDSEPTIFSEAGDITPAALLQLEEIVRRRDEVPSPREFAMSALRRAQDRLYASAEMLAISESNLRTAEQRYNSLRRAFIFAVALLAAAMAVIFLR
jgi:hypothetical protein